MQCYTACCCKLPYKTISETEMAIAGSSPPSACRVTVLTIIDCHLDLYSVY